MINIILCLLIVIISHEAGHMIVALLCGVKVEAFAIGFGKILLHKEYKGIDFRLCLFPLGGYCKLHGENTEIRHISTVKGEIYNTDEILAVGKNDEFGSQPYWKKLSILVAGVFMNLLTAIICYFFIFGNVLHGIMVDWTYITDLFTKNYFLLFEHPTGFLADLAFMSFFCFIGNLLPIMPLDGGHIWYQAVKKYLPVLLQKIIIYSGIFIVVFGQIWLLYYLIT